LPISREAGYAFDGEQFVATADVKTDEATNSLTSAFNSAQQVWDGEEFVAKLDADGEPTDAAMARAKELGLAWNGQEFVAVVDAHGDGAIDEVTRAREAANQFEGDYDAFLNAGMQAESAQALAHANSDYEGAQE